MDDLNDIPPNVRRYPPNSNPPKGLVNSDTLKKNFVKDADTALPKLQDFNQMF